MNVTAATVDRLLDRFAVTDAERDLLALTLQHADHVPELAAIGITPASMIDARHAALLAVMIELYDRHRPVHAGDAAMFTLVDFISEIARLRQRGADDEFLASAADLDGGFLLTMWTHRPAERHTWDTTTQFLAGATRERLRDHQVEACIAALAHGADPERVWVALAGTIGQDAVLDPNGSQQILSIPTKEQA